MRDLVLHTGQVHRWANANLASGRDEPADATQAMGPPPADTSLVEWFREGYEMLAATIENAQPDLQCWTFMAAPSPLAFWARRQCHETGMHRVDAQSASASITPFPSRVAADGIDELLRSFVTRSGGRLKSDTPRTLLVATNDTGDAWTVRISDKVETELGEGTADCTVRGSASDLHLLLWNRLTSTDDTVTVEGDASLLDLWSGSVQVRWGR
jgi:uncharacterized protein (TIGR03083 family)